MNSKSVEIPICSWQDVWAAHSQRKDRPGAKEKFYLHRCAEQLAAASSEHMLIETCSLIPSHIYCKRADTAETNIRKKYPLCTYKPSNTTSIL